MVSVLLKQSVCYLLIQLPTFVKRELLPSSPEQSGTLHVRSVDASVVERLPEGFSDRFISMQNFHKWPTLVLASRLTRFS